MYSSWGAKATPRLLRDGVLRGPVLLVASFLLFFASLFLLLVALLAAAFLANNRGKGWTKAGTKSFRA